MKKFIKRISEISKVVTYYTSRLFSFRDKFYKIDKKLFLNYMPTNPVIIEAGAHIGTDTIELSKIWPNGKIYAFEPIPDIFRQLKFNTKSLKNIIRIKKALGDKNKKSEIFVSGGESDASSSLLKPKQHLRVHPNVTFKRKTVVEVLNLATWAKKNKLRRANLLWLDLQGMELKMMKASAGFIRRCDLIYTEVSLCELYERGEVYSELRNWMEQNGFTVLKEYNVWKDSRNVLFIRKNYRYA